MMARQTATRLRFVPLLALIFVQAGCTVLFLAEALHDLWPLDKVSLSNSESLAELAAAMGLALGLVFEIVVLGRLLRAQAHLQQSLSMASGAPAFTIKGFSIAETAGLRGSAEGTIKTHLNAIYRKSGVSGRAQLLSVLIEELFQESPPKLPEVSAQGSVA